MSSLETQAVAALTEQNIPTRIENTDVVKGRHSVITTSIVTTPAHNDPSKLQVVGRVDHSDGTYNETTIFPTIAEYATMSRIAKQLAEDVQKNASNPYPEGSNLLSGMQLALISSQIRDPKPDIKMFDVGTPSYDAAKKIATENQTLANHELAGKLETALISWLPQEFQKPQILSEVAIEPGKTPAFNDRIAPAGSAWSTRATESKQKSVSNLWGLLQ